MVVWRTPPGGTPNSRLHAREKAALDSEATVQSFSVSRRIAAIALPFYLSGKAASQPRSVSGTASIQEMSRAFILGILIVMTQIT
jgi:hypothetical protein